MTHRINTKILLLSTIAAATVLISAPLLAAQAKPAAPPAGSSFDQRLAQRKAEQAITLSDNDQKRLINTCVGAQGKIRSLQQSTSTAVSNRAKTYRQIDGKLWVMIGKLKIGEKDTFELEKERATLAEKVSVFQATAQNYQQTIDDLLVINCQADPTGFKALLETARAYRTQLRDQSSGIRTYVVDTIKPTLSNFATELQPSGGTGEN